MLIPASVSLELHHLFIQLLPIATSMIEINTRLDLFSKPSELILM